MYTTIRPACSLFYDLLLPLSLLLLLGVSPAESQSIAALHPSSVPASALRITVFGSGFNVSRDYSCGIAGAGGVTAACPRAIPRSSTMIECTYVPAALDAATFFTTHLMAAARLGRALVEQPLCSFRIRHATSFLHCPSLYCRHGHLLCHLLRVHREAR